MVLGALVGLLMLGACFGALYWLLLPGHFPITRLELTGNLKHSNKAEIEAALPRVSGKAAGNAAGNFFAADLAALRAGIERLPWVRRVSVRRVWPGRIEVSIEEHVALARWGDDRLVNTHGETFSAKSKDSLPAFVAPGGTSAEVTRRYRRFSEIVAPLGTSVERIVLTPRHAWQLRLGNGLHLMLGRDADIAEQRLQKFVEAHPATLARTGKKHEYVDLRYPNGFALRVPDGNG
ncbi:MAG TPA: cell division protein FtsQ/DivIB [Burkholderiales bacterium]|nr:cell division protein FtsQ/DivIB [Burkholderiales bacterium]